LGEAEVAMMINTGLAKIQHVMKFIEDVFGHQQSFEVLGSDEVIRNEGRRSEDVASTRTFLEQRANEIVFTVNFRNLDGSAPSQGLPAVFSNPDYPKVLRNRYRELNRVELKYWKIDYSYALIAEAGSIRHQVTFRFTVSYGGEC
jgi:hypothetical protein